MRSTASPTVPPNSFLEVKPSMLPLYHMTQPAKDSSTRRAPVYTSRSPKSRPWISSGAKTPSSRDIIPNRSITTANTSASLQWDKPSYLGAMAALENRGEDVMNFYQISSYAIINHWLQFSNMLYHAPAFTVKPGITPVSYVL